MNDNTLRKMVRDDLLATAKRCVDTSPDPKTTAKRMVEIVTGVVEALAILTVPFPADDKANVIITLMDQMESKTDKFREIVARDEAAAVIARAAD